MKIYVCHWENDPNEVGGGGFNWYCGQKEATQDFLETLSLANKNPDEHEMQVNLFDLEISGYDAYPDNEDDRDAINGQVEDFLEPCDFTPPVERCIFAVTIKNGVLNPRK